MTALTPEQLKALAMPRLCILCEQEPALVGMGSNYCDGCRGALSGRPPRDEPDEMPPGQELEAECRTPMGGHNRFGDNVWRGD